MERLLFAVTACRNAAFVLASAGHRLSSHSPETFLVALPYGTVPSSSAWLIPDPVEKMGRIKVNVCEGSC